MSQACQLGNKTVNPQARGGTFTRRLRKFGVVAVWKADEPSSVPSVFEVWLVFGGDGVASNSR